MAGEHILIVEDDEAVRSLLAALMRKAGYTVTLAVDWTQTQGILPKTRIDLILLDLTLPDARGVMLVRELRAAYSGPVIIVSERGAPDDRASGLELGAEDYLPKPVFPRELLARVRNVLDRRRPGESEAGGGTLFRFAGCTLDASARIVTGPDGLPVDLTPAEFDLLQALVRRPTRVHSREELMEALGTAEGETSARSIDILVSRLRKKLGEDAGVLIETARGHGYRFAGRVSTGA
ncbi:DNA-binding response regulator [Elstera cyanobacteriorum]|uniref:DNA-binding response regulator n=1 Tax=Elstera cyanobacteriorum TaxID=2022747 RepID=A0A255XS76_9PROT|nr:response regulator transcription factor [Elstera cyanobacteriorum]OYQ19741.1 hypothetical protein CHR90_06360 [Elstera cyanobacteriorum]GFZ95339.1 DNA-binding response regulator [Elstera cyanobacteriorum]